MSVAILSSADGGGAGIAAARRADALRGAGIATDLLGEAELGRLPAAVAPRGSASNRRRGGSHFSLERPGLVRPAVIERLRRYAVVDVHWAAGLVGVGELFALAREGRRIVLTLHDFNHVTGGCHYPAGCRGWTERCIGCPELDRTLAGGGAPPRLRRARRDLLAEGRVALTAPSAWLAETIVAGGAAPAERVHVLRNPYVPLRSPRRAAERGRGDPRILLVADDLAERRKNVPLALKALALWRANGGRGGVDLVGAGGEAAAAALSAAGIDVRAYGRIADPAAMAAVLAAADVVLLAATEDNWPNVLVEAGAYGAAAVVGPGHGAAEFVALTGHGRVAADGTAEAFAAALGAAAALPPAAAVRAAARVRAEHDPAAIAARFRALFLDPLSPGGGGGDTAAAGAAQP